MLSYGLNWSLWQCKKWQNFKPILINFLILILFSLNISVPCLGIGVPNAIKWEKHQPFFMTCPYSWKIINWVIYNSWTVRLYWWYYCMCSIVLYVHDYIILVFLLGLCSRKNFHGKHALKGRNNKLTKWNHVMVWHWPNASNPWMLLAHPALPELGRGENKN